MNHAYRILIVFLSLIILIAGCTPIIKKPSSTNVGGSEMVEGYVMKIDGNLALVTESPATAYWFSNTKNLSVGQRVQVKIEGPVMESYPMQAAAQSVEIIPVKPPELSKWTSTEVIQSALSSEEAIQLQMPIITEMIFNETQMQWEITMTDGIDQSQSLTITVK